MVNILAKFVHTYTSVGKLALFFLFLAVFRGQKSLQMWFAGIYITLIYENEWNEGMMFDRGHHNIHTLAQKISRNKAFVGIFGPWLALFLPCLFFEEKNNDTTCWAYRNFEFRHTGLLYFDLLPIMKNKSSATGKPSSFQFYHFHRGPI